VLRTAGRSPPATVGVNGICAKRLTCDASGVCRRPVWIGAAAASVRVHVIVLLAALLAVST